MIPVMEAAYRISEWVEKTTEKLNKGKLNSTELSQALNQTIAYLKEIEANQSREVIGGWQLPGKWTLKPNGVMEWDQQARNRNKDRYDDEKLRADLKTLMQRLRATIIDIRRQYLRYIEEFIRAERPTEEQVHEMNYALETAEEWLKQILMFNKQQGDKPAPDWWTEWKDELNIFVSYLRSHLEHLENTMIEEVEKIEDAKSKQPDPPELDLQEFTGYTIEDKTGKSRDVVKETLQRKFKADIKKLVALIRRGDENKIKRFMDALAKRTKEADNILAEATELAFPDVSSETKKAPAKKRRGQKEKT